jgi:hypothetical protein
LSSSSPPALEPRELEVDLLDLRLPRRDLAVLALQQRLLLGEFPGVLAKLPLLLLEPLLKTRL